MPTFYDTIIIGLGAMGSAAAYHLATKRQKVLGLEQFTPAHSLGSSAGETRIIREAYFEGPIYVPLVQRAYELWNELEAATGARFFQKTGGLTIGNPSGFLVEGAKQSAIQHNLPFEILSSQETRSRFPALNPDPEMVAVSERNAGILKPDICIQAHLRMADKNGATLHFEEPVLSWKVEGKEILVTTTQGEYRSNYLLLCAGAWTAPLMKELSLPLQVSRQVLCWFEPLTQSNIFGPGRLPVFLIEFEKDRVFYGFPDVGNGIKVAIHREGEITQADQVRRTVEYEELSELQSLVSQYLPQAAGKLLKSEVCMYTNTPDGHFLIDVHPEHSHVWIASPCSGHGFKFSSAIGEWLSELLMNQTWRYDLEPFQLARFSR
jgi:sarcosine oxidase